MSPSIHSALDALNRRLVNADAVGQALDLAGGENPPMWVYVFRDQIAMIQGASEVLEQLLSKQQGEPS